MDLTKVSDLNNLLKTGEELTDDQINESVVELKGFTQQLPEDDETIKKLVEEHGEDILFEMQEAQESTLASTYVPVEVLSRAAPPIAEKVREIIKRTWEVNGITPYIMIGMYGGPDSYVLSGYGSVDEVDYLLGKSELDPTYGSYLIKYLEKHSQ